MIARRMLMSIVLAVSSRALGAQDTATFAGADRETSAALIRIVRTASARGLPIDHIVSKVRLALVVHAPPAHIIEAAQAVADRLGVARDAIAPDSLPDDIGQGEYALSFKVPKNVLTRVHTASPRRAIAVPIGVLTQLVVANVPPDRAGDIVIELMRRGATSAQLASLGNDVNSDVQRGARAMESLDIRFRGLTPLLAPTTGQSLDASAPTGSSPRKP